MDSDLTKIKRDLAEAAKQHMPAMVVMVHEMRATFDRIEALEARVRELERPRISLEAVKREAARALTPICDETEGDCS